MIARGRKKYAKLGCFKPFVASILALQKSSYYSAYQPVGKNVCAALSTRLGVALPGFQAPHPIFVLRRTAKKVSAERLG